MSRQEEAFMSSKEPLLSSRAAAQEQGARRVSMIQRHRRPLLAALLVVTFISLGWIRWSRAPSLPVSGGPSAPDEEQPATQKRIPLEAHIMSKCPDAQDCLRDLVVPAMEQISDKVDFKLSYIGTPTNDDDGVACKHGPSECLGNILELCAAALYPSVKTSLGFAMCLTNHFEDIPERNLIEDCALEHGLDFNRINACVSSDDGYGVGLLRDSVERSADAGVKLSCTVRIDEKVRCVRDGGEWKDCEGGCKPADLVRDVEKLYSSTNSASYGNPSEAQA